MRPLDATIRQRYYVADDGPGIPEEDREQVFKAGHTTSEEGTGFGLAIVGQVADARGWDVSVTDSEDDGARFEITGIRVVMNIPSVFSTLAEICHCLRVSTRPVEVMNRESGIRGRSIPTH